MNDKNCNQIYCTFTSVTKQRVEICRDTFFVASSIKIHSVWKSPQRAVSQQLFYISQTSKITAGTRDELGSKISVLLSLLGVQTRINSSEDNEFTSVQKHSLVLQ